MATNIFNSDGTLLTTVADGSLDTTHASIRFPGRGYLNYGEPVNENMLWIMQNFANSSAPANPLKGQLWYDTANAILKVYDGSSWNTSGGVVIAGTAPSTGANQGALWFDSTNKQLYTWSGTAWLLVGPLGSAVNADPTLSTIPTNSVIQAVKISDGTTTHQAWRIVIGGTLLAIFSKDTAFTPTSDYITAGFSSIKPGLNFSSNVTGAAINDTTLFRSTQNNLPDTNNTRNLGSAAYQFLNVYSTNFVGTASAAKYADLAERYKSDVPLLPGTVVCLGGRAEVTACRNLGDPNVFGVVSTNPAYLMNSDAGENDTHPPIAFVGRVPAMVLGPVYKFQRLMASSTEGAVCAWNDDYGSLAVIGRALEDHLTNDVAVIEIVIGKN
jgi:hypothetical protein